jgi:hypothetical protein
MCVPGGSGRRGRYRFDKNLVPHGHDIGDMFHCNTQWKMQSRYRNSQKTDEETFSATKRGAPREKRWKRTKRRESERRWRERKRERYLCRRGVEKCEPVLGVRI